MSEPETLPAVDIHQRLDSLELAMLQGGEAVDLPLVHRFTPGLYAREIFMPAGTLLTSKIHKTEHPYVVLSGRVSVYIPDKGVEHIEAPYVGVTEPLTRRVLYIHEDCRWVTFHPNPEDETVEEIEERIIERRELPSGETTHELYLDALDAMGLLTGQADYGGAP